MNIYKKVKIYIKSKTILSYFYYNNILNKNDKKKIPTCILNRFLFYFVIHLENKTDHYYLSCFYWIIISL